MRITFERVAKGLTQAELARKAGCNPASLCRIEKGKEPAYSGRAKRLADAIGWKGNPSELFEEVIASNAD